MIPQLRDVTIEFSPSCTCCGRSKEPDPDTPAYINSRGVAEKFDERKCRNKREAIERSLAHLQSHIDKLKRVIKIEEEEVKREIGEDLEQRDRPLPFRTVSKINSLFERMVRDSPNSP